MGYGILRLSDRKEWQEYIYRLPADKRDVYFTPGYCELGEYNGDGKVQCFYFDEAGQVVLYPFVINEIHGFDLEGKYYDIETPYGYGGPVSNSSSEEFLARFEDCFLGYCLENNIVAEFIRFHPLIKNQYIFRNRIQVEENRVTVVIPLDGGMNHIWECQISSKNRNMIRRARKAGISIRTLDIKEYGLFTELYLDTMKRLQAQDSYYFSRGYFTALKDLIKDCGAILGAFYDSRLIAGSVFLYHGDYFHYHLSGSDNEYLNLAPNNLLLYQGVQLALDKGCKFFHLGGGRTHSMEDTLYRFKGSFSRSVSTFYIGKRIHQHEIYRKLISDWEIKNNKPASLFLQYKMEG